LQESQKTEDASVNAVAEIASIAESTEAAEIANVAESATTVRPMLSSNDQLLYGNMSKQLFRLALPTMGGYMFQSLYDMVDLFWIGYISADAVASMTIFSTMFWLVDVFNEIVGTSSVSLISQYHGNGNKEKTQIASERTLAFKFIWSLAGALFMAVFLKPLVGFFSKEQSVINYALDYGYIRVLFIPIFFSSYSVNTIFRCTGDAKTPMRLLTMAAIMNMILDPLLMFDEIPLITPLTGLRGAGMGMAGAAWATVTGQTFSFVVGLIKLMRGTPDVKISLKNFFKSDKEIDTKLITIGLPSGINLLLRNIFNIILMKIISTYGTAAVAILGIGTRLQGFCMMPQTGFSMGSGIILGHALGADMPDRAKECVRKSNILCALVSSVFAIFFFICPSFLLSLFLGGATPDKSGIILMYAFGINVIVFALMVGFHAAFSGSGLNRPIMYSSLIAQYCFQLPYAVIVYLLGLPVTVLWFAYTLGDVVNLVLLMHFYKQDKWITHRVY
jgi:putative MATE family efflux protein